MSSRSHGMTGPQRGGGGDGGVVVVVVVGGTWLSLAWHRAPLSKLFPGATLHSPQQPSPALTPDLPSAIFFNTRVKWEGTNHSNYIQWVLPRWLCKVRRHDGPLTVSLVPQPTCEPLWNVFIVAPKWDDCGDWAHQTDNHNNNNNMQLTSRTCSSVSPRSPNGTYFNPFGYSDMTVWL